MGPRIAAAAVLLALVHAAPAAAGADPAARSWAAPEIRAVTAAGLMDGKDVASFRPGEPLTAQALENLVFGLKLVVFPPQPAPPPAPAAPPAPTVDPAVTDPAQTATTPAATATTTDPTATTTTTTATATTTTPAPVPPPAAPRQVADPGRSITLAQLDARLVKALGLAGAAQKFVQTARTAGLRVPARFGTEVVARLLGLRTNHPASQDSIELLPTDPATRAEAAYSAAQILRFADWQIAGVQAAADGFALPAFSTWQTAILNTAVARIGMPYIWGGASDGPEAPFGVPSRGGYDCSGFVWRVYKTELYPGGGLLPAVLRGRTTFQMSAEVPAAQRIPFADLQPADLVFFGARGPKSSPAQVDHMGIYLGNGWLIHSSEYGVALAPLEGWYRKRFAWGRRPLREAGLAG